MRSWSRFEQFLRTDTADIGCEETFALIDLYVELLLRGGSPELLFPGVFAHLAACGPCAEDFAGLLVAVGGSSS